MDIPITDASFSRNTAHDGAEFDYPRRPSLLTRIIVTAATAIVTIFAPATGAGAGGATTGLPVVASLADARMGSLLLRDGLIAAIEPGATRAGEDMGGDYIIPGLVELHTDHLEGHYAPRPKVRWAMFQTGLPPLYATGRFRTGRGVAG